MKFADALELNTKENLKNIASLLKISIPSRLRKKEYAMALAESFLLFPEGWLTWLTKYELLLLRKLVNVDAKPCVEEIGIFEGSLLHSFSIVFVVDYSPGGGKVGYMIFDELREAIALHIDNVLSSKEQAVRFTVEQYAYGLINLYGFLPYLKMQELLDEYLQDSVTEDEISWSIGQSLLIGHLTYNRLEIYDSNVYVVSPLLLYSEELEERLFERPRVKELKHFSKEEVFEAGRMPLPHFPCAKSDELKEYMMTRLEYTEAAADNRLHLLWTSMQEDGTPMSLISSIIGGKLSSTEEVQEAMGLFVDYCNQCPRWFLKGYSSTEAFDLFVKGKLKDNPPRLLSVPNMLAAGMDITPKMQANSDNMLHNAFSEQKVGRNDPCPCGSGKKYKKCCGGN
nr:SEC-C metal-binding domain-containing protein [uncultured Bacteroides sp.]